MRISLASFQGSSAAPAVAATAMAAAAPSFAAAFHANNSRAVLQSVLQSSSVTAKLILDCDIALARTYR